MTKLDYILVAETLNKYFKSGDCWPTDDLVNLVKALAHGFEQNNSKFQWAKFMSAVYDDLPCGEEWKYRVFNTPKSDIVEQVALERGYELVKSSIADNDERLKGLEREVKQAIDQLFGVQADLTE